MTTSLHAALKVFFGKVYFVMRVSIFMVKKMRFSVVKKPNPENRFLVNLRSFFSFYNSFPGRKWLISVITINDKYFNENLGSLAGLKKKLFNFPKCTDFRHFWLLRSTFKVDFLNVHAKLQKIFGQFPRESC